MSLYTRNLWNLAEALFAPEELQLLHSVVAAQPLNFAAFSEVDDLLGGPSVLCLNQASAGQYALSDRDVFRPLEYCAMYFCREEYASAIRWYTRLIVQMSGLHIEILLNKVGDFFGLTLGHALHDRRVRWRIGPDTWLLIDKFRTVYNAAKRELAPEQDARCFSVEDAVLAFFVSRKLGESLYPLANVRTPPCQIAVRR